MDSIESATTGRAGGLRPIWIFLSQVLVMAHIKESQNSLTNVGRQKRPALREVEENRSETSVNQCRETTFAAFGALPSSSQGLIG